MLSAKFAFSAFDKTTENVSLASYTPSPAIYNLIDFEVSPGANNIDPESW